MEAEVAKREDELEAEIERRVNARMGAIDGDAEELDLYLEPPAFDDLPADEQAAARAAYREGGDPFAVVQTVQANKAGDERQRRRTPRI